MHGISPQRQGWRRDSLSTRSSHQCLVLLSIDDPITTSVSSPTYPSSPDPDPAAECLRLSFLLTVPRPQIKVLYVLPPPPGPLCLGPFLEEIKIALSPVLLGVSYASRLCSHTGSKVSDSLPYSGLLRPPCT